MPDQHPSRRSSGHSSGGSGSGSGSGSGRGPSKKRLQARRRNSARAIHATGRLLEAISQDRSESASRPSSSASLGPALSVRPQPLPSWNRGARVSRSDRRDAPQDAEERRKTERRGRRRQGKERQEEDRNLAEHLSGLRQLVLTDAYKILAPTLLPIIDDERLTAAYRISSTKKAIRDLAMGAETSAPEEAQPEPVPEPEPVSEPEPEPMSQGDYGFLVPDEEDCQGRGHVFRGVTQPPVGIRLQQILSYLSGEDVYSDADWRERVDDIGAYLDFLEDRPTRQAPEAGLLATPESAPAVRGRQTKLMLAEARRRLRAHRVFNDYHEGVVSGRVELLQSRRAIPVPSGRRVQVSHVLQDRPFPVGEIRATTEGDDGANVGGSMGEHYPEAERYRAQLARDDERLLLETVLPGESPPRRPYRRPEEGPNLANEENTEFHADLAAHRGWVDTAPEGEAGGSGGGGRVRRLLPDGTTLEGDAISYARERGARRAGLQLALSQFGSPEEEGGNDMPQRDVVLPLSASDVQDEVDRVTGLWPREASGDNGGGGRWIQPYTFYMAQYREWRAEQRRADAGDGDNDRRMLQLLRETTRQLERSGAIAPRQLLSDVHEYMEQGFRGGSVPPSELVMRNAFDWAPADSPGGQRRVRRVNETEVHWLRFLLTDSTNPALARPLESEPDAGRATLYRCFARRLQALLDDRSDDRLFATAETRVPVAAVAAAINASAGAARDARQKMRFSLEDASFFCDRLSRAGRCCFWHDPFDDGHGGGHVQRPVLTVHPEHRIFDGNELAWGEPSWLRQQPVPSGGEDNNDSDSDGDDDDDDDDDDDAVGAPRRSTEVDASWEQTLESGRPDRRLRAGVRDFFCTLAFRFGVTLREMEAEEAARSGGRTSFQQALLLTWRQTQAANPDELVDVVRQADPEAYRDDMTAEEARSRIRRHLIAESESPNRPGQAGRPDHLWDWADAAIVGTAPQFFNMDRWPLALQTRATQTATKKRKWPFDPEMAWDPASEDPTPVRFRRVRPRPIGFSKRVVRHGPAAFELGDTALQRQAVIEDLTARVARSIGGAWALPRQSRWRRWMGAIPVPFVGRVLADGHDSSDFSDMIVETTGLPRVAAKAIPSSGQLVIAQFGKQNLGRSAPHHRHHGFRRVQSRGKSAAQAAAPVSKGGRCHGAAPGGTTASTTGGTTARARARVTATARVAGGSRLYAGCLFAPASPDGHRPAQPDILALVAGRRGAAAGCRGRGKRGRRDGRATGRADDVAVGAAAAREYHAVGAGRPTTAAERGGGRERRRFLFCGVFFCAQRRPRVLVGAHAAGRSRAAGAGPRGGGDRGAARPQSRRGRPPGAARAGRAAVSGGERERERERERESTVQQVYYSGNRYEMTSPTDCAEQVNLCTIEVYIAFERQRERIRHTHTQRERHTHNMSITVGIKLDFLVARIGPDQQLPSVPWDQSLVIPPLLRAPSCMPADQHERYVLNCVRDRLPPQSLVLPPPVETGFGAALTQRREPDIQFPHQAWPLFWVVQPAPGLTADMTSDCPYRWTPVKVTSPVLAFAPGMKTDQPLAQAWMQKLTTPLQSVRLGLRTQVSSACRLVVHVGFGDDSDDSSLLALKRLATVLWLGESVLGRLRSAERHTADEEQPLNAVARLAQRAQYDVDDVLAAERADVDAAFVAWMAPVVGPPPAHAEVRDQAAAVRRSLLLMLSSADVVDRAGASRVAGVDASRVLLHELYLLWRAPSRDLLARLLTAHAGPGLPWPADADLQHGEPAWTRNVAYDFANLRAAARVQSRLAHHATLAFRLPMGTLDPALVAAWADLAGALAHRTATCSAADWRDQVLPRLCRPSPDDADLWWLLAWAQVSADTMGTFWRHVRVQGHQSKTDELGLDGVMWQPLE